jgi:hypothetical protein
LRSFDGFEPDGRIRTHSPNLAADHFLPGSVGAQIFSLHGTGLRIQVLISDQLSVVKHSNERNPMFRTSVLIAASGLCVACATTPAPTVNMPDKLKPANESLAMVVPAKGVQIYECREKAAQAGSYEWAFVAPEAILYDDKGNVIGKHYAGPHWEATDGSKIAGKVKERADAPSPDAIPWLLLSATSAGKPGAFSKISSVQRVTTVGGVAPKDGCSQPTAGNTARVNYTADYYFLSPN